MHSLLCFIPRWSSGYDSALSQPRAGFDSPSGKTLLPLLSFCPVACSFGFNFAFSGSVYPSFISSVSSPTTLSLPLVPSRTPTSVYTVSLSLSFPFLLPLHDMSHRSALLLVDVQNDFLPPNGSLAVPSGDTIISILHRLLDLEFDLVIASQVRWSIATSHSLGQTDDLCLNRIIIPEVMFRSLLVTPLAKLSTPSKCNIQSLVQTRIKSCGRTTAYRVRQEQISRRA